MKNTDAKKIILKDRNISHVGFRFFVGENMSDGGREELSRKNALKDLGDNICWDGYDFFSICRITEKYIMLKYRRISDV